MDYDLESFSKSKSDPCPATVKKGLNSNQECQQRAHVAQNSLEVGGWKMKNVILQRFVVQLKTED